jgi:phenylalanyl-tRNA synthetase alpha chain
MSAVTDRIAQLRSEAETAITGADSTRALEELRVRFLGRKAELPQLLRGVRELPPDQRGEVGQVANQARAALEALIERRAAELDSAELDARLREDRIDVTLPGDPPQPVGRLHLITATRREIEDVFLGLGFDVVEGPEVETVYYNFDALNHLPTHPARARTDTFYVSDEVVLRTHTSPVQVRAMETHPPPLFIIVPGTVYRPDTVDATHLPVFSQVEGLAVAEDITLGDLAGTLQEVARALFGPERETRLKPDFFPFTEPSVQVDVSCFRCGGSGLIAGERDPVCKGTGWIEILGAGMVDPNVFGYVAEHGYDPDRVQGFAFGMGIERIAFLKHGVPDLRIFYENDVRFLGQF